jgi:hypothetical protein
MFSAVPYILSEEGYSGRTAVGGDFNLEYDKSDPEDVQNCVPGGYIRKGDGDVQHVIFSEDFVYKGRESVGLANTDHVAFFVELQIP